MGGQLGDGVVGVLRSQMKLQALDFWMRNPDYLADELLSEFEKTGNKEFLKTAADILDSSEPELRRFPMIRYLFGAFEPLDDALALLRSADFIRLKREVVGDKIREHIYLLTARGRDAMHQMAQSSIELNWYLQRAKLVVLVAGDAGGTSLKDRQYKQAEYASTQLKATIAPIAPRVRARLEQLRRKP
jgi:hypothetical protein